jgi:hypothetical protein
MTFAEVKQSVDSMTNGQLATVFIHVTQRCFERGVFDGDGMDCIMQHLERQVGSKAVQRVKPIARRPKRKR